MTDRSERAPKGVRRLARGYTMIELVMAMAVFSIGVTGVAAMQNATTTANRHAKNLAVASSIARAWQENLTMDATMWTQQLASLTQTNWIDLIDTNDAQWVLPPAAAGFGPSFDALGSFNATADEIVFCSHIRLTRLLDAPQSGLVRTEVRVFWPKQGYAWSQAEYCGPGADPALFNVYDPTDNNAANTELDNFHFVYATSAVRQTPGF